MYGVKLPYRDAKALFDRTKGRALLRFVKVNVYVVLTGAMLDAGVKPWPRVTTAGVWHHA